MDTASKHNRPFQVVLILLTVLPLAGLGWGLPVGAADLPGLQAWQAKRGEGIDSENIGGAFFLPASTQEELQPVTPDVLDEGELQLPGPGLPIPTDPTSPDDGPYLSEQETIRTPSSDLIRGEPLPFDGFPTLISSGSWLWDGRWYTQQEMAMMVKSEPRSVPLSFDGFRVFTTTADRQGYELGTRLTLGRILGRDRANRDHAVEFTYQGLFDWESRASFSSNDSVSLLGVRFNGVLGLGVLDQFDGANNIVFSEDSLSSRFVYRSQLDNFEMNLRIRSRPVRDRMIMQPDGTWERHETPSMLISFFGGLRYMQLDETFLYSSVGTAFGTAIGVPAASPIATSGAYNVSTQNHMVGLQLGAESIEQHACWHWGLRGRVGGLINFADRESSIVSTFGSTFESAGDEALVFLTEGSLFASYQLRPNLAVRASYDFMWVQGLALASENVGITTMPLTSPMEFRDINIGGGAVFHGMFLGFDYVW